jgi:hypothetical protein
MMYAYRTIIVSALLLCNYWLEFNKTLWEPSIPKGDVHIIALFLSDTFYLELWSLISYAVCIYSNYRFRATSLQLLAGIQRNFMGIIKYQEEMRKLSACSGQAL